VLVVSLIFRVWLEFMYSVITYDPEKIRFVAPVDMPMLRIDKYLMEWNEGCICMFYYVSTTGLILSGKLRQAREG
jgi:hypothetical protein